MTTKPGRMKWHQTGEKKYETGIFDTAMYLLDENGDYKGGAAPWNGVTGFTESPSGAESNKSFALNEEYLNLQSLEEFGGTIEAFTYPDLFAVCDGSLEVEPGVHVEGQAREMFGFVYKTVLGNDTKKGAFGYKLHLVYKCLAAPSERAYTTINTTQEPMSLSWEISTSPERFPGGKSTARLTIDSTKADPAKLKALEDILFGTDANPAYLPKPEEVIELLKKTQG